jgi:hypothetical protein
VKKNKDKEEKGQPRRTEAEAENKKTGSVLPDTVFKILTRREIEQSKLRVGESEIQYISRSDLVLEIPPGVELANTLFEFCAPTTVIEFKSQNDQPFGVEEFVVNHTRTSVLFLQALNRAKAERKRQRLKSPARKRASSNQDNTVLEFYGQFLNLYVVARYPQDFMEIAQANAIIFKPDPDRLWLHWASASFQRVALVVCRDLPLEKRFYNWLLFAPSNSKKWEAFIRRLRLEGEKELLDYAEKLRPKEFEMIRMSAEELWEQLRQEGALTPEVEAQLARERAEAIQILLSDLDNKDYLQMSVLFDDMDEAQVSQMLNALSSLRLVGLISSLKPYQIERAVPLIKSIKQRQLIEQLLSEQSNQT